MKGVVGLDTHISDPLLVETITMRDPRCTKLVLYDTCSKEGCVRTELCKHAEVLYKTNHSSQTSSTQVYYLDGECTCTVHVNSHVPTMPYNCMHVDYRLDC